MTFAERLQKQVDFMQSNPNIGGLVPAQQVSEDFTIAVPCSHCS